MVVGENGKVASDGDLVFYNQPSAPGVSLRAGAVTVDPDKLRFGAERVVLVASPEQQGAAFGQLPPPVLDVRAGG
nr:hypothetical protein [Micromonospora sp. DSM 115978]